MTWRVFLTDSFQPDLDALTPADRSAITEELFAWVPNGRGGGVASTVDRLTFRNRRR